jgi:D-3-phosphoglycerate dehydrogenase
MPLEGTNLTWFAYANGVELRGKTLGIVGIGRIGQATAKMAFGLGMKVIAADRFIPQVDVKVLSLMVNLLQLH